MLRLSCLLPAVALLAAAHGAAAAAPVFESCRLKGIERELRCGTLQLPEDPDQPQGRRIAVRFAVVPALAKNKSPDPLFVLAGGPGQAATRVAGQMQPVLAQINARRDIVYVDQRGTGGSNALDCDRSRDALRLSDAVDPTSGADQLDACFAALAERADLRQYATWIAVRDFDAVRAALGAERINLWGGSYGTRAALEYLRQFPQHVRSVVLDGVAPAGMALPASLTLDGERSLQAFVDACKAQPACAQQYPQLDADLAQLLALAARGKRVQVTHPLTGDAQTLTLDRAVLAGLLRAPLYAPQLASVLPFALGQAAHGNYDPLVALSAAVSGRMTENFAVGMHFAVVCTEDVPRVDAARRGAVAATRFGSAFVDLYERACRKLPTREVPAAFYAPPTQDVPVLLLSGGADPATPPHHAEGVAAALPRALHLIAPNLGHGVSHHGCAPQLIARFLRQADAPGRGAFAGLEDGADAGCLARLPAPPPFRAPALPAPTAAAEAR